MFSKVSRKPVQLSQEEVAKLLQKTQQKFNNHDALIPKSPRDEDVLETNAIGCEIAVSDINLLPSPSPSSTSQLNDKTAVMLPRNSGTNEDAKNQNNNDNSNNMLSFKESEAEIETSLSDSMKDYSSHRTARVARDRSLSKSLSPTRSPTVVGIKGVIGEVGLPHLSLDPPRKILSVSRRRVRLTSDDIQLERLTVTGNNNYLICQPHIRERRYSSPGRVSNKKSEKDSRDNINSGMNTPTKQNSDGVADEYNKKYEFKSSQLLRQNNYTRLTLLQRNQGKSPWVLKQLSNETYTDPLSSLMSEGRNGSDVGEVSPSASSRNGSTGGSSTSSGYSAAIAAMSIEIRILKKLANVPYICHLRENYIDRRGIRCLVMEYAEGGNMLEWLRMNGGFPEQIVKVFVSQLVIALQYLHTNNIAHRDLKPENILMKGQKGVQLSDFGLAIDNVNEHNGAPAETCCGTLEYMAPEVACGKEHGYSVDCWSLGAVIYEMIRGVPIFLSGTMAPVELIKKIRRADYYIPENSNISADALSFMKSLLEKDQTKRMSANSIDNTIPFFRDINFRALESAGMPTDDD